MKRDEFEAWLARYGEAWEARDPEAAVALFGPDATYQETPFDPPMVGADAIRAYWAGVPETQRDIRFDAEVLAIADKTGFARWRCSFTRIEGGARVELDGIFEVVFGPDALCVEFREWWHSREAG